jgi:hypothetical protein
MIALVATNLVGVVLFTGLYAIAGARYLSQAGFLMALPIVVTLMTLLWLRVEVRHGALDPLSRVGRAAASLMIVLIGVPVVVLLPIFWLETVLPPEVGMARVPAPAMTLVLISLVLVVLVNVIGSIVIAVQTAMARSRGRRSAE